MTRLPVKSTHTAILGTPNWEEDFTLDPSGNWTNYTTLTGGTTTLNQSRLQNTSNEITTLSGSSIPSYDAIGNMLSTPVPGNWGSSYTLKWDAWNRLVQVASGGTIIAVYGYDGLNRRITQVTQTQNVEKDKNV